MKSVIKRVRIFEDAVGAVKGREAHKGTTGRA